MTSSNNGGENPNPVEKALEELSAGQQEIIKRLDGMETRLTTLEEGQGEIKKRLEALDSRLFELSLRSMSANSNAFFGVGIAVLSAVIAFVVAVVSQGRF